MKNKSYQNKIAQYIISIRNFLFPENLDKLKAWFEKLDNFFRLCKQNNSTVYQKWFKTSDGKLVCDGKEGKPLYQSDTLILPPVKVKNKFFTAEISQTTLITSPPFFGAKAETASEIYDIYIFQTSKKSENVSIQFEKSQNLTENAEVKYSLKFSDGRQLAGWQSHYFMQIVEKGIKKMKKDSKIIYN